MRRLLLVCAILVSSEPLLGAVRFIQWNHATGSGNDRNVAANHPYVDGNERVGAHAVLLFLGVNEYRAEISPEELEELTLTVARGELDVERLAIWFRQRITRED